MIVFLSDLHLIDETAGRHNLPPRAYEKMLQSLNVIGRPKANGGADKRVDRVDLVFLGDIVDVIRTTSWWEDGFGSPFIRPWGASMGLWAHDNPKIVSKTRKILSRILETETVKATCQVFKQHKAAWQAAGVKVRFHYVPGNHDRFLHADDKARARLSEALGLDYKRRSNGKFARFPCRFSDASHGIVAFHGHELDVFNFGRVAWDQKPFDAPAYALPSIGEAITIEIVSRLPHLALPRIEKAFSEDEAEEIMRMLRSIDNIRPVEAVFPWLQARGHEYGDRLTAILDEAVEIIFTDFVSIDFVKTWSEQVGQGFIPRGRSRLEHFGAWLLDIDFHEHLAGITSVSEAIEVLGAAEGPKAESGYDTLSGHPFSKVVEAEFVAMEDKRRAKGAGPVARHIICGHTHAPECTPICGGAVPRTFFDAGTFRPRIVRTRAQEPEFVEHKSMSYVVVYSEGDISRSGAQQRYEYWESVLAEG